MGLGVVVSGGGAHDAAAAAQAAERAGLDSVWATEFYDRSATIGLAAMANATESIALGSAIMYAFGRTPLVLAAEARDLDELCGGRLTLGARHRHAADAAGLAWARRRASRQPDGGARAAHPPRMAPARGTDRLRGTLLPPARLADRNCQRAA